MAPMSKEEFEKMVDAPTSILGTKQKRCNWNGVRMALAAQGWTTDEVRTLTAKYTVDGKPMSRLRTRNYLLGLVKNSMATRKLAENVHIYFVKDINPADLEKMSAPVIKPAYIAKTPLDEPAEDTEETEEDPDEEDPDEPE